MNDIILLMYLADLFKSIGCVAFITTIILLLFIIILAINYSDTYMEEVDKRDRLFKLIKKVSRYLISCLIIIVLIPSPRTVNTLIASTAIKELSTIQSVNVIGNKAMKIIDSYLDKVIKENTDELTEETK